MRKATEAQGHREAQWERTGAKKTEVVRRHGVSSIEMSRQELNNLTSAIIEAGIEVHRELGPGLLESIYEECLAEELELRHFKVERQVNAPVHYKGRPLGRSMRMDMRVEGRVLVEVKTVDCFHDAHRAQLLTYLKLTGCKLGLLLNFNEALLKEGIMRVVNGDLDQP